LRVFTFLITPLRVLRSGVIEIWFTDLDCLNKATRFAYTQVTIMDVSEYEEDKEGPKEEL
jgi:hypothetical protein